MLIPKVEQRITQYLSFLEQNAYRKIASLEFETYETGDTLRSPPADVEWEKIETPAPWGSEWRCTWFRSEYSAPKNLTRPLFLSLLPNADSMIFIDGKPAGAFNLYHNKLRVEADGKKHVIHLEAYAGHPWGGCGPFEGAGIVVNIGKTLPAFPNTFEGGWLLERFEAVHSLFYDIRSLFETAKALDGNSLRRASILREVYNAVIGISFNASGETLEAQAAEAAKKTAPLLAQKNSPSTPAVYLAGHAHIDHAWLWHIGETERKVARTFANMIRFIKEYPEFIFIQSQPCQLEIVYREYPDVFAEVKEAYAKGNWEPNGGMWVEADCNIPSGESLIRQFLVGKQASKELLGYEADTLWLPDVFGYAAALPQILAGCRIKYFVTSKINWNDTTRFPYDTFIWRGIDGTGINSHFISAKNAGYNGRVTPQELTDIWNEVQHKEVQSACVRSIGEGDGGGGTLRADLEMARRLNDLEGCPKAQWKTVSSALESIFSEQVELPEWRGELYLELHRGTYTTQSRTKRNNRLIEFGLRGTEFLCSLESLDNRENWPGDKLLECWKKMLTNQFHDIIPGSCIGRVYTEAEAESAEILSELAEITSSVRKRILSRVGGAVLAVNDLGWERNDVLTVKEALLSGISAVKADDGTVYPVQRYINLDGEMTAAFTPKLPSLGWRRFSAASEAPEQKSSFVYSGESLETPFFRIAFDSSGRITSLIIKETGQEMVAEGGSFNALITAEDVPVFWDAWDIDADWTKHITEETRLVSTEAAADGAVCFRLRRKYDIGTASTLVQDMVCYSSNPRIDFENRVQWNEKWRLLKVEFDTALDTTQVRCEVQYGHIWRNTHKNLMQDRAKFEICAHKWISLEEDGGGIALLNDCKYGHDVHGGRMRLSLLRSPIAPDPDADRGSHAFTYAILPFSGSFAASDVIASAYELNSPSSIEVTAPGTGVIHAAGNTAAAEQDSYSLCTVDNSAVIIESVKIPEDRESKTLILRLYESRGGRTVRFSGTPGSAFQTDMLEENPAALALNGNELALDFRPFEIKTIRVIF